MMILELCYAANRSISHVGLDITSFQVNTKYSKWLFSKAQNPSTQFVSLNCEKFCSQWSISYLKRAVLGHIFLLQIQRLRYEDSAWKDAPTKATLCLGVSIKTPRKSFGFTRLSWSIKPKILFHASKIKNLNFERISAKMMRCKANIEVENNFNFSAKPI